MNAECEGQTTETRTSAPREGEGEEVSSPPVLDLLITACVTCEGRFDKTQPGVPLEAPIRGTPSIVIGSPRRRLW